VVVVDQSVCLSQQATVSYKVLSVDLHFYLTQAAVVVFNNMGSLCPIKYSWCSNIAFASYVLVRWVNGRTNYQEDDKEYSSNAGNLNN
jgi:hypothetical protein